MTKQTNGATLTENERATIAGLRARGFAVTIFNPGELAGADSSDIEQTMTDAANDAISFQAEAARPGA
jgi:hypothetical protein